MSKYLCTFSGRFGDILWSLPTVRELSKQVGEPVDMMIMAQYKNLLPLLNVQPYIDTAYESEAWSAIYTGSPCGDQPWEAPVEAGRYGQVWHLTYRQHPVAALSLHIATQAGILLPPVAPFIETDGVREAWVAVAHAIGGSAITYGFGNEAVEQKNDFVKKLFVALTDQPVTFCDVRELSWQLAARAIAQADFYIGDRSALTVIAHGTGKRVLCYEPNPSRRPQTFGCPWGQEVMPDVNDFDTFVRTALAWLANPVERGISA